MFCTKCGKQVSDNSKFCPGCGAPIKNSVSQQQVQPVAQPQKSPNSGQPVAQPQNLSNPIQHQSQNAQQKMESVQQAAQPQNKNKSKTLMIILAVILVLLVLAAAGMTIFYFAVLRNGNRDYNVSESLETVDESAESGGGGIEETDEDAEPDAAPETSSADASADSDSAEEAVESSVNEVIKGEIITSLPKAEYSYNFDGELGNAQVVVREADESLPKVSSEEPQYVSGMDGKAVYLDGTYGIQLSDVQSIGESYTIAFWMKADTLYDWAPFIHIGNNLLDSGKRCRLWLGQKTDSASVAPIISSEDVAMDYSFEIRPDSNAVNVMSENVWYHIVFTVDGTKKGSVKNSAYGTLYVSGRYAGDGTVALNTMNRDGISVYLGINCWDKLYPAAFDDVKIWKEALSEQQVLDLFNAYN